MAITKKSPAKKKAAKKKAAPVKKTARKKAASKKTAPKRAARKPAPKKKNKLGVKNSLVNNINARKKKGVSRSKSKSTISKRSYNKMEDNWGKK